MKFPRTPHIPGSRGTDDDIRGPYRYKGTVIATEKMDGSNIMMNRKGYQARSGNRPHENWGWPLRGLHYEVAHLIPEGTWLAGEFLYWRKHQSYEDLPGMFVVFGAMRGNNCLAWDEVVELAANAGLPLVNVLAGPGSPEDVISSAHSAASENIEGFVVRPVESFPLARYADFVGKWVGAHHESVVNNNGLNGIVGS